MDPESNRFKPLTEASPKDVKKALQREVHNLQGGMTKMAGTPDPEALSELVLPDGKSIPSHWAVFTVGEDVVIKGYTFRVAYIGDTSILFEPVGIPIVGEDKR